MSKKTAVKVDIPGIDGAYVEIVDLEAFADDPYNANAGSEEGDIFIEASLSEHGGGRSVLVDRDGVLIAGNKTAKAARAVGIKQAVVLHLPDGNVLPAVQRGDLDLDEPETGARLLAYRDNRAAQISLHWDDSQVTDDLGKGIDLSQVFTQAELDAFLVHGRRPASIEAQQEEHGEPEATDFWPVIRIQVSPSAYRLYMHLLTVAEVEDGNEAEKFHWVVRSAAVAAGVEDEDLLG